MTRLQVQTRRQCELVEITADVQAALSDAGVAEGVCTVCVPHTTAAVTINENADPTVISDFLRHLDRMVPLEAGYDHAEGNSAAHIKAILTGPSVAIPVEDGRLALGRWQGIFFCEYDGPRRRSVQVTVAP